MEAFRAVGMAQEDARTKHLDTLLDDLQILLRASRKKADEIDGYISNRVHAAAKEMFSRKQLLQLNMLANEMHGLSVWPTILNAVIILAGGWTISEGVKAERLYAPHLALVIFDMNFNEFSFTQGAKEDKKRWQDCQTMYSDMWCSLPYHKITARKPKEPKSSKLSNGKENQPVENIISFGEAAVLEFGQLGLPASKIRYHRYDIRKKRHP
jgi:hypothetical protein